MSYNKRNVHVSTTIKLIHRTITSTSWSAQQQQMHQQASVRNTSTITIVIIVTFLQIINQGINISRNSNINNNNNLKRTFQQVITSPTVLHTQQQQYVNIIQPQQHISNRSFNNNKHHTEATNTEIT
jgi:hypothetical protein